MLHNETLSSRRKRSYLPGFKLRLLQIVKDFPFLYQINHPQYRAKQATFDTWCSIATTMSEEFGMDTRTEELANELAYLWRNLRDQLKHYRRQARFRFQENGTSPMEILKKWEFFEGMQFLNDELNEQEREFFSSKGEMDPLCNPDGATLPFRPKIPTISKRTQKHLTENFDTGNDTYQSLDLESLFKHVPIYLNDEDLTRDSQTPCGSENQESHTSDTPLPILNAMGYNSSEVKPPRLGAYRCSSYRGIKRPRTDNSPSESSSGLANDPLHRADPAIVQMIREKYFSFLDQSKALVDEFENELLRLILDFNAKAADTKAASVSVTENSSDT